MSYRWVKNLLGSPQLIEPLPVAAGSSQKIAVGQLCYNNSGTWTPVTGSANYTDKLAIAADDQEATDSARLMDFTVLQPGDVIEAPLTTAYALKYGDAIEISASNSSTYADYDTGANATIGYNVKTDHFPETGTSIKTTTYAEILFTTFKTIV